jgi:hypothetical protein
MRTPIALAIAAFAGLAAPAFAQTTTTVQTQPQAVPPPPPTTTTTVQTQPAPAPSTQVVVNPSDAPPPPPAARVRVAADRDVTTVETRDNPPPLQIVAVDALYGGLIGTVIGGGVTLIESGNNWQRDLAVGAGVGVLAGAAFGVYDASSRSSLSTRAAADPVPGASNSSRSFASLGGKF